MEYDIESILEKYEDDYNPGPRPMNQGPRNMYGDGGITEGKKANKGTFYLRIPNEDGVKIAHSGTKFQMEQLLKKYKERLKVKKIPSNRLTADESKIVLEWGKNKSKALGETWSDKKTLKEYNNLKEAMRTKVKTKRVTGTGGSWSEGQIKPLTTEQKKLWDATMADEFGEWKDYPAKDRNRWRGDFPRKQKIYSQTKDLLNIDELAEYLGKEFDTDISRNKIRGSFGAGNRTALGQYIRDNLFVDTFGSIKGKIEGEVKGNVTYYKKPTKTQIDQIKKQNLVFDTRTNTLRPKTLKNIKILNEMYGDAYRSGTIPKLQDMMDATGLPEGEIAKAEARLAQIYNGHKFRNGPDDIRVNKNTASKLFNFMSKAQFGNPRKTELYSISLDLIDEGLGNEKNTFYNLKNKAKNILKENGIKVYSNKSPIGFNIDELAGVTGSAKSKNMAVSQFINVMEGNLNQTILQNFQGQLSKSRQAVEAAKGTPSYNSVLKKQMELINTRAANLEAKHGVELARLERPADINNMSADEVKRLKNIKLGTNENLYQRLVKDAKASGYSVKMPPGTLTIQEFVDPKNKTQIKDILKKLEAHGCKGKAAGGRILFSEGTPGGKITECATKGVTRFVDDLKKGNYSKATLNILKGGGNLIKNIVNPMELLKLKNLIGPGAMGLMAAWEGGVITDDVIRQGTPLNESLANNWLTKSFLPYTKDYAKAKNLLESGTVPSNMKKYVQDVVTFNDALMDMKGMENRKDSRLVDDSFGMIDGTSMYTKEQEQKENTDLMKKLGTLTEDVYTPGTAKALEMKSLQDEMEATRMAKKEFSPIFGFDKLKDVRTPGYTGFDYIPDEQPVDLRPITYKDFEYTDVKMPVGLEQAYMNELGLKPRDSLSNYFFKDGPKKKTVYGERKQDFVEKPINILQQLTDEYNMTQRAKQASQYPGYGGTQEPDRFMEGGIASLNVKK